MTLRNAFAGLLTESITGAVEQAVTAISDRVARETTVDSPRALMYARDASDQMRVVIGGTPVVAMYPRNDSTNGWNAQYSAWFGNTALFAVDEREQQRIQSEQQFNAVRMQRWVIT